MVQSTAPPPPAISAKGRPKAVARTTNAVRWRFRVLIHCAMLRTAVSNVAIVTRMSAPV